MLNAQGAQLMHVDKLSPLGKSQAQECYMWYGRRGQLHTCPVWTAVGKEIRLIGWQNIAAPAEETLS